MLLFTQVTLAFIALAIAGFSAKALRSFKPPFYILAGVLLGPAVFNMVTNMPVFELLGEIGLIFLLFYLGYEFSLNKLVDKKGTLSYAGAIDFVVNFGIAMLLGWLLGFSLFYVVVFAGLLYMSSSSIITKSLIELEAVNKAEGEVVMGIMIVEDLAMIIFLVIIGSIAETSSFEWLAISQDIGLALLFSLVVVFIGRKYASVLDKLINHESHELAHIGFLAFVLLGVVIGQLVGVSHALTAFLLGLVVSETKHKREMEELILKFRDIFGGIFFFYFGMTFTFDMGNLSIVRIVIIIVVATVTKVLTGFLMRRFQGCDNDGAWFIGLITIPRGEFSLIIAGIVASTMPEFTNIAILLILGTSLITTGIFFALNQLCKDREVCLLSNRFLDSQVVD